jgi:hypothetical protein
VATIPPLVSTVTKTPETMKEGRIGVNAPHRVVAPVKKKNIFVLSRLVIVYVLV